MLFNLCPLLPPLLNVFFLLSTEQRGENGSFTHSVCYSHHTITSPDVNFSRENHGHGLKNVTFKQTLKENATALNSGVFKRRYA